MEQAHQAWLAIQQAEVGSLPAQQALQRYDLAVIKLLQALREHENTNEWGTPMSIAGAEPWQVTFDRSAAGGRPRTFVLSQFSQCRTAAEVSLAGFDRVVARDGLGVPVVLTQDDPRCVTQPFHPPHGEFLPATAVLEFTASASGSHIEAKLRFYNPQVVSELKLGKHSLPIAFNLTAALQSSLADAILDENGPRETAHSASGEETSQLFFLNRYDSSKVPVIFVHGLLSGASVWKNAVNELFADPGLRHRYQPVCFEYPSTLPIPVSAARLRELLKASRDKLDPGHHDAGFGNMVLVGHSMGGLLSRMQVIDSGNDFWQAFFTATPREISNLVDARTQRVLRSALFFKHDPDVKLVVFISTPHQGSAVADVGVLRAAARLILFLPKTARDSVNALTALPPALIHPTLRAFHDWGVDGTENLSPKHPFFQALSLHPIGVPFDSIIATRHAVNSSQSSDGVVPYTSAHLEGAASEVAVPYGHECLEKPETVKALMHILKSVP